MKTIKIIAYIIIFYVAAFMIWWMVLLTKMETQKLQLQKENYELLYKENIPNDEITKIEKEYKNNRNQIIYEGVVFLILLAGSSLYVINGINKEKKFQELKRNFLLATTHELKTPLSITKLNIQTLLNKKVDPDKKEILLHNSLNEINRLNQLVSNILLASKIDAINYKFGEETIDLSKIITKIVTNHPEKARINLAINKEESFIKTDLSALEIILNNVIDNALKYGLNKNIDIESKATEKSIIISIKDYGIGIPKDQRKKIFKRFYRIEDERTRTTKGTGLGLFLVNEMMNQMNGSIVIKGNEPMGSIFELKFPLLNE